GRRTAPREPHHPDAGRPLSRDRRPRGPLLRDARTPRAARALELNPDLERTPMAIASVNPTTGETLKTFEPHSPAEVERRVDLAARLFPSWRATSFAERALRLTRAAEILDGRKAEWARTMTLEMGKPIGAALAEAEKCGWVCRYYAENAERFLADE